MGLFQEVDQFVCSSFQLGSLLPVPVVVLVRAAVHSTVAEVEVRDFVSIR